uniref:DUF22 domain-containing protein n=1 Tax=Archaeoglobus fulgidus TaxID=2234 RepID=A0A7J2TKU1_ARCFL
MNEVGYRTGKYAYWKVLVAKESVDVSKGKALKIPVEPINLPPRTMVSPLSIMRHALGSVFDVRMKEMKRVEEEKRIEKALFMPIRDGSVRKGDVIGILKVYPTAVGKDEPEAKVEIKKRNAEIVYFDGKIKRMTTEVEDGWYRRWHLARWIPLIADEDLEVRKGEVCTVKIRGVEIPESTIPVPLNITINAIGSVLDVISPGKPRKVEEKRFVNEVIFVPTTSASIERGDLLGVLNIFYISLGNFIPSILSHLLGSEEAKIVYAKNGTLKRKTVKMSLLAFKRSEFGVLKPVVSAEDRRMNAGEIDVIRISKLDFPSSTIAQPIAGIGGDCSLLDLYSEVPRMIEEDKSIDRAIVCAVDDVEVKKGEVIGALAVYNVAILIEPQLFIAKYAFR